VGILSLETFHCDIERQHQDEAQRCLKTLRTQIIGGIGQIKPPLEKKTKIGKGNKKRKKAMKKKQYLEADGNLIH